MTKADRSFLNRLAGILKIICEDTHTAGGAPLEGDNVYIVGGSGSTLTMSGENFSLDIAPLEEVGPTINIGSSGYQALADFIDALLVQEDFKGLVSHRDVRDAVTRVIQSAGGRFPIGDVAQVIQDSILEPLRGAHPLAHNLNPGH